MRGVVIAITAATALVVPGAQATDGETCQGKPATIVQGEGIVEGTDGDDVIVGGQATKVRAGPGNDLVCVTGGLVEGGDGVDAATMLGTDGADFIDLRNVEDVDVDTAGGPDHVRLEFNDGYPRSTGSVDAGNGLDLLSVVATRSSVGVFLPRGFIDRGHTNLAGVENVFASGRGVFISGNRGDNRIWADGCRVELSGGGGDDVLRLVERHWITKACDERRQVLRGSGGDDRLYGGRLGDVLRGGSGVDSAFGRNGVDRCSAEREMGCER